MSKYESLWKYLRDNGSKTIKLSFEEITDIAGAFDHSFLNSKHELSDYGYEVGKISLKEGTVQFIRIR